MEENKEKTDDPSDHHGGINTMDKVTECLDALIEEMRESRAYQNYLWMEEKLEKDPRASRIRRAGNRLAVAALSVLADEQFCVLSIHRKQPFSAVRALLVRQVVVAERSLFRLDLIDQFHRVAADLLHKHIAPLLSLCNVV